MNKEERKMQKELKMVAKWLLTIGESRDTRFVVGKYVIDRSIYPDYSEIKVYRHTLMSLPELEICFIKKTLMSVSYKTLIYPVTDSMPFGEFVEGLVKEIDECIPEFYLREENLPF